MDVSTRTHASVLIVDDTQDTRDLYAHFLSFQGIRALLAGSGEEGLEIAASSQPDVIVMDIMMPGMTGTEAIRRLKADARTSGIPVIALTASHDPRLRAEVKSASCDSFLTKPCMPERLADEIHRLLARQAAPR
jgi:two-component system, cell cycle response regulator DivK